MPRFTYQPGESKFDLPEGTYRGKFLGAKETKFDKPSKFGNDGPRLEWSFEVQDGPQRGKVLSFLTGADPSSPKSNCFKVVRWLLGRTPTAGEDIDTDAYRGLVYEIDWEVNPLSEAGNCHVARMKAVQGGPAPANGAPASAPPPRQAPPPRPGRPPASAAPPPARYWVQMAEDGEAQEMDLAELTRWVTEGQKTPRDVQVCPVGGEAWTTAEAVGVKDECPF
jgi:hypothetical protein